MGELLGDIKKHLASIDWFLVIAVFLAMAYGCILIKSATNTESGQTKLLIVHGAAIILGTVCMFILSKMDYNHVIKYAQYLYILAVVSLILTLVIGVGDEIGVGNKSWIRIPIGGGNTVGLQPSEIVKIIFILTFAKHLDTVKEEINSPKNILLLVLHFVVILGLVLLQKDLGSALIFIFIFAVMLFAAGASLWYFLGGLFMLVASSPLLWRLLSDNQRNRILVGFDYSLDPQGLGFQPRLSQWAIGSGGLFGAGYQQGDFTQGNSPHGMIPFQWTDFIYSAAGEEFGFIGAILVLLLLAFIISRIFMISRNARNTSGSLICVGVMTIFIAQIVENIGMCLAMLPVIGITLPFFSYGGSSILSSLLGIGVVLSVKSRTNIYYFTRDEKLDEY